MKSSLILLFPIYPFYFRPRLAMSDAAYNCIKDAFLGLRPGMAGASNDAVVAKIWVRRFSGALVRLVDCFVDSF